jgi:transketolase
MNDFGDLKKIAKLIRQDIFKTAYAGGTGHIAPAFSLAEIMATLYFGGVLRCDPQNSKNPGRDRLILSKGHACLALYVALCQAGFFPSSELGTYCLPGSRLGGHPKAGDLPGVEASTGALGHGLSFGLGVAMAGKMNLRDYRVYVILGDGECQEGSVWEAAMSAAHWKLDNLTAIIDHNKLQAMDRLENILDIAPLAEKWRAFGWHVEEVDGHDIANLKCAFDANASGRPKAIIAHTVKGKGVSFMENIPLWHFRFPNEDELEILLDELEMTREELRQQ